MRFWIRVYLWLVAWYCLILRKRCGLFQFIIKYCCYVTLNQYTQLLSYYYSMPLIGPNIYLVRVVDSLHLIIFFDTITAVQLRPRQYFSIQCSLPCLLYQFPWQTTWGQILSSLKKVMSSLVPWLLGMSFLGPSHPLPLASFLCHHFFSILAQMFVEEFFQRIVMH